MVDFKEIQDSETWELFARDFLQEHNFYVESTVDRGADGGKDIIVSERLKGNLGSYNFRWLVSCKHNAHSASSKAVSIADEHDIVERMKNFSCDGFIGFYSTVPSASLNTRLQSLKDKLDISDYRVFDHKSIESRLLEVGVSGLLKRYFPQSYSNIKPAHLLFGSYRPIECRSCKLDLIAFDSTDQERGNIVFAYRIDKKSKIRTIEYVYWACKGSCDRMSESSINLATRWDDINDIAIPVYFIHWILSIIDKVESGKERYSPHAYTQLKYFISAMSQRVLRKMTASDQKRADIIIDIENLGF